MGNCQAAEAATVVIEHPGGRVERLYWPTTAEDVMKSNPEHHVALVTLCIAQQQQQQQQQNHHQHQEETGSRGHVRFTRVRLLKPKDFLLIGQVYRLIPSQEVNKALSARKHDKIRRAQAELIKKERQQQQQQQQQQSSTKQDDESTESSQDPAAAPPSAPNQERGDRRKIAASSAAKPRQWRPSLQSISESLS